MLSPEEADRLARQNFTYLADPVALDLWRSHADAALDGRPWSGDCDDLASTVLDILGRAGTPLADRYRLFVSTRGLKTPDHMIAAVRDRGRIWIVGDTFRPCYSIGEMAHRACFYQRMDEVADGVTREGRP